MDKQDEIDDVEISDDETTSSIEESKNVLDDDDEIEEEDDFEIKEEEDDIIDDDAMEIDDMVDDDDEIGDINNSDPNVISKYNLDDDDDSDDDENYLQKIDKNVHSNILQNYHPELKVHNNEEIKTACQITRNEKGIIIDPLHKTLPFITCYEKTRIIGERTKQLDEGAKPFVDVDKTIIDNYLIAMQEYKEKKIPFIIQRPLPNGNSEYWKFCDLECLE